MPPKSIPLPERFWSKVDVREPDECWPWLASKYPNGYGICYVGGGRAKAYVTTAHRVAYELTIGPAPNDMHIHHTCRNRECVNPAHLELLTPTEHNRKPRAWKYRHRTRKTHCKHGHEFTPENTYVRSNGTRACIECNRRRQNIYAARRRASR